MITKEEKDKLQKFLCELNRVYHVVADLHNKSEEVQADMDDEEAYNTMDEVWGSIATANTYIDGAGTMLETYIEKTNGDN